MLSGYAMRLVAPARHAAVAGRVLVGSKIQQGPAQLHRHPWSTRAEATDAAQTGKAPGLPEVTITICGLQVGWLLVLCSHTAPLCFWCKTLADCSLEA
jgi:hypothetical protein